MEPVLDFEKPIATLEKKIQELKALSENESVDFSSEIVVLERKLQHLIQEIFDKLNPWQRVQLSRHPARPYTLDYIDLIFENFVELHGDRCFGDDAAMVAGFASLEGKSVAVVGIQKGRNTKEKVARNFGMAKPEGYRKALRVMKLAAQFDIPIVTFIDTPGAYPGVEAEERGQSEAIARAILESFDIQTPIIACIIGEGGSGGALAIGVADAVLMQEYSTYSVISPESCASILWSDSSMCETAASIMKMTPAALKPLAVIDQVVKEPAGGAHRNWPEAARLLKEAIHKELKKVTTLNTKQLLEKRHQKFRTMGTNTLLLSENTSSPAAQSIEDAST